MVDLTVLISCKDKQGIIASTTNSVAENKGNIVYIDQHVDLHEQVFFMRIECVFTHQESALRFQEQFELGPVQDFQMDYEITTHANKPVMALMVSKYDHCLYDLLGRYRSGEMDVEIPLNISNHKDLEPIADAFKIPFYHIPVRSENKKEAEDQQLKLLHSHNVDFIVLARYMQIVSKKFLTDFKNLVINIHHSFLPAFPGAKPYHSAYKRGVKVIGATSHYVTEYLDEGHIIEQDVVHVDHAHSIDDLIIKGRDLEKIVLARAIKNQLKRK